MPELQEVPIKSYSIAVYICRISEGTCQHLIIKRTPGQLGETWQMISGLLEAGETAIQAALREIGEETGLVPERLFSANVLEGFYEIQRNCIALVPVFVGFVGPDQQIRLSHEHQLYRWVTSDEAADYLVFPHQIETIKSIEANFVSQPPNPVLEIDLTTVGGTGLTTQEDVL